MNLDYSLAIRWPCTLGSLGASFGMSAVGEAGSLKVLGLWWKMCCVSFVLQVLDEFSKQVDRIDWPVGSPATIQYTALDSHLSRYQVSLKKRLLDTAQKLCDLGKVSNHDSSRLMYR